MKTLIQKESKRRKKERLISAGFSFCSRRYTDGDCYVLNGGQDDHYKSNDSFAQTIRGRTFNSVQSRSRLSLNSLQRSQTDVRRNHNNSRSFFDLKQPDNSQSSLDLKKPSSSSNLTSLREITLSLSSIDSVGSGIDKIFQPLKLHDKSTSEKSMSKIYRVHSLRRFSMKRTFSKSSKHQSQNSSSKDLLSRTPFKMFLLRRRSKSVPAEIFRTWSLRKNRNSSLAPPLVQGNYNMRGTDLNNRDGNLDDRAGNLTNQDTNLNNRDGNRRDQFLKNRSRSLNRSTRALTTKGKRRNAVCEVDIDERLGLKFYLEFFIKGKKIWQF